MSKISPAELQTIPLFEGLPEEEIDWLLAHSHEEKLDQGERFFEENGPANRFYIVLEGELQVTRKVGGQETVLGTTPRGIMGGELSLLYGAASLISSCAIVPSRLLVLDHPAFRQLFAACPSLSGRVFKTAFQRTQLFTNTIQQQEKMAALGKLSAGLAHELNNPAAAASRAACLLRETLPRLQSETLNLSRLGLDEAQLQGLVDIQEDAIQRAAQETPREQRLSPVQQSDREEAIGNWLEDNEIDGGWQMASNFVNAGLTLEHLQKVTSNAPTPQMSALLTWLNSALEAAELLNEIETGTSRISELVKAIKSYTFSGQDGVQEIDLHQGLESTLTVLRHKMKDIQLIRQYDRALPRIFASGGELNQVWTNLIDNAIDALESVSGEKKLWLITRVENHWAMVEIADNGPGIPPENLSRIFDPFFTTKEVGEGTGLGLDISYRIITGQGGTLEVQSEPGHTRFIVRLPVNAGPEGRAK